MDDSAETMREMVMKLITTSCIKQLAVLMLCSTIGEAFSSSGARMGDKDLDAALWRDREGRQMSASRYDSGLYGAGQVRPAQCQ